MASSSKSERPALAGRFSRDLGLGGVILLFCAIAYYVTLGFADAPSALAQNVQPSTFPRMVIFVIVVLTALMMVLGIRHKEKKRHLPKPTMLITGALMVLFVLALETIGLMAAMLIFSVVTPLLWGARPSVTLVLYALLFPAAIYVIFVLGLGVHLPPGLVETAIESLK